MHEGYGNMDEIHVFVYAFAYCCCCRKSVSTGNKIYNVNIKHVYSHNKQRSAHFVISVVRSKKPDEINEHAKVLLLP